MSRMRQMDDIRKWQRVQGEREDFIMKKRAAVFFLGITVLLSIPPAAGAQWVRVSGPEGGWIRELAVIGEKTFAAAGNGSVFLSIDHGASWKEMSSGFGHPPRSLAAVGTHLIPRLPIGF